MVPRLTLRLCGASSLRIGVYSSTDPSQHVKSAVAAAVAAAKLHAGKMH